MKLGEKKLHKKIRKLNGKNFVSYEFAMTSEIIKCQLQRLGCKPKKTYDLRFPSTKIVPKKFQRHFVRGYIDGDGSVTNGTTSVIVLDVLGTKEFINSYQQWTGLHQNKVVNSPDITLHATGTEGSTVYLKRKHDRYLVLRRLRLKTVRRPKTIIAEFSKKGLSKPDLRLKALLKEIDSLQ